LQYKLVVVQVSANSRKTNTRARIDTRIHVYTRMLPHTHAHTYVHKQTHVRHARTWYIFMRWRQTKGV
jgi:hypothetical protein